MSQLLARGPVAEVHAAETSALKVFPGRFDRRTLVTIRRERARLARAEAAVLPFTGVEVVDGRHALRMELCVESLAGRVRRTGPLPSPDVAALCENLSGALAAAHRLGVLHGGLKPENVLFRASGAAVLADFGVAQRQMFPRDLMHGVEWQAPETLRTGELNARADLYGLGAVLHFALTGESPHPSRIGETTAERLDRVFEPPPAISRPDVPVRLATTIGRMLAPDPAKRSGPWTDEPPRTPERARRRTWRRFVAGSVAVLVAALTVPAVVEFGPFSAAPDSARARETSSSIPPPAAPAAPVIDLADPVDLGNDKVRLSWTTTGGRLKHFTVQYWDTGTGRKESSGLLDGDTHTTTLPVPSGVGYCFQVIGSSLAWKVESEPRALHGATCDDA